MNMDVIAKEIRESLVDGQLPCVSAFAVAARLEIAPIEVGQTADEIGVRLSECQLGLFGYGPKSVGKHRRVRPMHPVPPELETAIRAAVGADGKLSCASAWHIAEQMGLSKQAVSDAAEGLGIRIGQCQLGAF